MIVSQVLSREKTAPVSYSWPIDVVIPWVDDSDPKWRAERDRYLNKDKTHKHLRNFDANAHRFRSWDNLQYIFRGIEKYMPWVRTIHLVTNGQVPRWLSLTNPKLNIVRHRDYIPQEFLPTFNSHTIELNLHRIPSLAEHFIYFNDDTYIIRPMKPNDFFSAKGLPRDQFGLWRVKSTSYNSILPHVCINNMAILNQNFKQRKVLREKYAKLYNPRNGGTHLTLTALMSIISRKHFANILFHHMPAAFLKQTFRDVWAAEPEILTNTSSHKFRSKDDVSQYVIRAWQMITGNFEPKNISAHGEHFTYLRKDYSVLTNAIRSRRLGLRRLDMFCVSDEKIKDFDRAKAEINAALDQLLPEKSAFEVHTYDDPITVDGERLKDGSALKNRVILQGS